MSKQTKIGWLWIALVLAGVPALYAASFGPVTWLGFHGYWPRWFDDVTLDMVYRPLFWTLACAPERISESFFWYAELWAPPDFP
jgi:hypothetical protein